jgi:HAD superfamily hydrolase (TIGR01549 family)
MIKNIIFDMDGVIIDSAKQITMFYADLMKLSGFPKPSKKLLIEAYKLTYRESLEKMLPVKNKEILEKVSKFGSEIYPKYEKYLKLTKNCKETLEELSKKFKLSIVTGRSDFSTIHVLEKFEIKKFFDTIVTYECYKKPKPDPEPILVALGKLNSKPEESIYVGDSDIDAIAAKAARVKAIIYSNKKVPNADFYIDSLNEIELIASNS